MIYTIDKNCITINNTESFNIAHILECGQVFNYKKKEDCYEVYSKNKMAKIYEVNGKYKILTDDPTYFVNFFDLNTNYEEIKNYLLNKYPFLKEAINFGYGIRILNQDTLEMIISFIMSANNNIPRIKKSISLLCEKYGTKMQGYYSFPSLKQLSKITKEEFEQIGLGYRSEQLVKTIKLLQNYDLDKLKNMQESELIEELLKFSGVGPKVADCIMLFGLGNKNVFPVDTWIEKVYNKYFAKEKQENRKIIRQNLTKEFKEYSGYAQQYLFYYERSAKIG